jgi:transcriptional regulator GlxA family with amidase domain
VKTYVEGNLSEPIRIEDLSKVARLCKTHFSQAFRQSFGETPHICVVGRRMDLARHLMLTTDIALGELAVACGLSDQAHLSRLFRQVTGESPAAWESRTSSNISVE